MNMTPSSSRSSLNNKRREEKYKQSQELKQDGANMFQVTMKKIFGFNFADITSLSRFKILMNQPRDPSGLGVWRIIFGKYEEVVHHLCHILYWVVVSVQHRAVKSYPTMMYCYHFQMLWSLLSLLECENLVLGWEEMSKGVRC